MPSRINQNWVFGGGAKLDFSTALPAPATALPTPSSGASTGNNWQEGCASISNANGKLVLYTDGTNVWDGGDVLRVSGLQGNYSSTQSAIIVPDPGNPAGYYVFTAGVWSGSNHFNGIHIDTGVSGWSVTQLSSIMPLPPTTAVTTGPDQHPDFAATEKVTAIQHANCRDFWVLTVVQEGTSQAQVSAPGWVRVFLVTPAGVQHAGDTRLLKNVAVIGYLKGSGDGGRIAMANWEDRTVLVFPFDNSSGAIDTSQPITITVPSFKKPHTRLAYGVEFSPLGGFLYYSVVGNPPGQTGSASDGYVFQYDFSAGVSVLVGQHPNDGVWYSLGALQRGMDDRIYIAQDGEAALGVIHQPDMQGAGCNLAFSGLHLATGSTCWMGLPNLLPNPCECACDRGNCDEATEQANQTLNTRADAKFFTVLANGQAPPAGCLPAFEQRDLAPLFSLHWGDGPSDQLEDHDTEIVCIRIRNPFRNLAYRGVKIFNIRITPNQVLPDGDNALQLIPAEIVCFDEVEPCAWVSRDFAFLIQNAVPKAYQITFDYCIEEIALLTDGTGSAAFDIDVVAS